MAACIGSNRRLLFKFRFGCSTTVQHSQTLIPRVIARTPTSFVGQTVAVLLPVCLMAVVAAPSAAQTNSAPTLPLRITVEPSLPLPRSHAPIRADVDLQWGGPGLLEGRLELTFRSAGQVVFRYESEEMAVSTDGRRFGVLLPPMRLARAMSQLRIEPVFWTADGPIELGDDEEQVLRVPQNSKRECVVAICLSAGEAPVEQWHIMGQTLGLESFSTQDEQKNRLVTSTRFVESDRLPASGLAYFGYDLLVLSTDAFIELNENQLQAILSWVNAGGSLCVVLNLDRGVTDAHVSFLNEVAAPLPGSPPAFLLSDGGRIATTDSAQDEQWPAFHRVGLGRAVLLNGISEDQLSSTGWTEAVLFLWKIRRSQQSSMLEQGRWKADLRIFEPGLARVDIDPFAPKRLRGWNDLATLLMPDSTRGVPLLAVVVTLAAFLFAIAPGDYLLLGLLKRRRYTWLLFPAVSLLFTLFTMQLARSYMGTADQTKALVIVDVVEGNRVARTTRYELLFTATEKRVTTPFTRTLFTSLDDRGPQAPGDREQQQTPLSQMTQGDDTAAHLRRRYDEPPVVSGVLPFSYSVGYDMQQWTPRLNRQTTLGGEVDLAFDFDGLDASTFESPQNRAQLGAVAAQVLPDCQLRFYHGKQSHPAGGEGLVNRSQNADRLLKLFDLVHNASVRKQERFFSIIAQLSPCGGRFFEDLALLDSSDLRQWLLLVVKETDNEVIVYRRLYFDEVGELQSPGAEGSGETELEVRGAVDYEELARIKKGVEEELADQQEGDGLQQQ